MSETEPGGLTGEVSQAEIAAGSLMTFTTGSYSDYEVLGVFRAMRPLDIKAETADFLSRHPQQRPGGRHVFSETGFLGDLARRGVIETVDCVEVHLDASWHDIHRFKAY